MRFLAEEMQAISKGLEKVVQELSTSEIDGPVSENFRKVFKLLVFFLSLLAGSIHVCPFVTFSLAQFSCSYCE